MIVEYPPGKHLDFSVPLLIASNVFNAFGLSISIGYNDTIRMIRKWKPNNQLQHDRLQTKDRIESSERETSQDQSNLWCTSPQDILGPLKIIGQSKDTTTAARSTQAKRTDTVATVSKS